MKPLSVRSRLTIWYTLVLGVSFVAITDGVWWVMRDSIHRTVDKDLHRRFYAMRRYLQEHAAADELAEQGRLAPAGTRYRIAGLDGRWIYSSPGTAEWDPIPPVRSELPAKGRISTMHTAGGPVRVISGAYPAGVVEIGIALDEFYDMLSDFKLAAVFATALILLITAVGGYRISKS